MKSKLLLLSIELFVFLAILIPSELLSLLLKANRASAMAIAMFLALQFHAKLKSMIRRKMNV